MNVILTFIIGLIILLIGLLIEYHSGWFINKSKNNIEGAVGDQTKSSRRKLIKVIIFSICLLSIIVGGLKLFNSTNLFNDKTKQEEKLNKEIPKIIQELSEISDPNILKAKLKEYKNRGILAVGQKEDFEPPDGCYVFFVDETNIRGPYQFNNNQFFDIKTKKNLNQLPDELLAMQQYWVIESYKLIQQ